MCLALSRVPRSVKDSKRGETQTSRESIGWKTANGLASRLPSFLPSLPSALLTLSVFLPSKHKPTTTTATNTSLCLKTISFLPLGPPFFFVCVVVRGWRQAGGEAGRGGRECSACTPIRRTILLHLYSQACTLTGTISDQMPCHFSSFRRGRQDVSPRVRLPL